MVKNNRDTKPPPMTLPQEIQKTIDDRELELTDKMPLTTDHQTGYYQGFSKGYTTGATEWAGKAEDLAEAMEKVKNITSWMDGDDPHCQALRRIVEPALAKYKEVSNG